jgi:hypothetical protein
MFCDVVSAQKVPFDPPSLTEVELGHLSFLQGFRLLGRLILLLILPTKAIKGFELKPSPLPLQPCIYLNYFRNKPLPEERKRFHVRAPSIYTSLCSFYCCELGTQPSLTFRQKHGRRSQLHSLYSTIESKALSSPRTLEGGVQKSRLCNLSCSLRRALTAESRSEALPHLNKAFCTNLAERAPVYQLGKRQSNTAP